MTDRSAVLVFDSATLYLCSPPSVHPVLGWRGPFPKIATPCEIPDSFKSNGVDENDNSEDLTRQYFGVLGQPIRVPRAVVVI